MTDWETPEVQEIFVTPEAHTYLIGYLAGDDGAGLALEGFESWLAMPETHPAGCGCRTHRFRDPEPKKAERIDGRCSWCRDLMSVPVRPQQGGRTKKFCSPACRQAEYRWRHDPERYPDREQWVTARKGMFAYITTGQAAAEQER